MAKYARVEVPEAETIEVFSEILDLLFDANIQEVADESGVSAVTLYFWLNGTTTRPRLDTLTKVGRVFGYELRWSKVGKALVKKARHLRLVKWD